MTKSRHPITDPTRLSFRLKPEIAAELARRAAEAGKSQGLYARDLVSAALFQLHEQQQELRTIRVELAKLDTTLGLLRGLRADFASSVAILLVNAGKLRPDQAHQWVQQILFTKQSPEEP